MCSLSNSWRSLDAVSFPIILWHNEWILSYRAFILLYRALILSYCVWILSYPLRFYFVKNNVAGTVPTWLTSTKTKNILLFRWFPAKIIWFYIRHDIQLPLPKKSLLVKYCGKSAANLAAKFPQFVCSNLTVTFYYANEVYGRLAANLR